MDFVNESNMSLLMDLYELAMCASYLENGKDEEIATFDLFIRKTVVNRSYYLFAGLEQVMQFLNLVKFQNEQLQFLKEQGFKDEFLDFLKKFRFTGDVSAIPEGGIVFPDEPLIRVTAPIMEAQIVETFLLNCINLQTMIATKSSRIVSAARGKKVLDFGLRRCHGVDAGIKAARASYIGGCAGTSNVLAGLIYGIPIYGTMAHSFVQSFNNEEDAFRVFARSFPNKSTFLIDTYDTIGGAEKAAKVAKEMEVKGFNLRGVRIDSGNLLRLSRKVRDILDKNGLEYVEIFASGDLDEHRIQELVMKNSAIDSFGVGTRMDTSADIPYVNVVYKLSDRFKEKKHIPSTKLSQDKTTLPGIKNILRQRDREGKYKRDIVGLEEEVIEGEPLLRSIMKNGSLTYDFPNLKEIREQAKKNLSDLPEKYKKLENAPQYPVELSEKLISMLKSFIIRPSF